MKKVLFTLLAVCCMAFVSCFKESEYTITYIDDFTSMANVTAFEYDGTQLVAKRELKRIQPNTVYEMTSSDIADRVVIGVEATVSGRITAPSPPEMSPSSRKTVVSPNSFRLSRRRCPRDAPPLSRKTRCPSPRHFSRSLFSVRSCPL